MYMASAVILTPKILTNKIQEMSIVRVVLFMYVRICCSGNMGSREVAGIAGFEMGEKNTNEKSARVFQL